MSLRKLFRLPEMLVFRLTLWYSGIFTVFVILTFVSLYFFINSLFLYQLDQDLDTQAEQMPAAIDGLDSVRTDLVFKILSGTSGKIFIRIIEPGGEKFASEEYSSKDIAINEAVVKRLTIDSGNVFETISLPKAPFKVRVVYRMVGPGRIVQMGKPMLEPVWLLGIFKKVFGIGIILLICCAGAVGWFMAKQALVGVEEVTKTAIHIYNGEYDSRVPIKGKGKEIDDLAITFNKMLERIQTLIRGMKEMTDNIAHDLRSPITRMRGIAEMTMMTSKGSHDYEVMAGNIIEECDRLLSMINMMLDISEAEAGISRLNKSEFNPSIMVEEACELFQTMADDKAIRIDCDINSSSNIYADEQKLQRVIANLLDNAVKYSPAGNSINVSVYEDDQGVNISIKDNGTGISQNDLPHIFKRFYRCDSSRSRPGVGLGLSWAQAVIQAHGGSILACSTPDEGSTFVVTVPKN
jgi:signal transduction histidine kinase